MLHHIAQHLPLHEGCLLYRLTDQLHTTSVATIGVTAGTMTVAATMVDPVAIAPWLQDIALTLGSIASAVSILLATIKMWRGDKDEHD